MPILIGEKGKKVGYVIFLFLILVFLGLRFFYIEADFPQDITRSGALYTDEGWYSNGAVAFALSGNWYIPGDFNPSVNLPVVSLIQTAVFSVFGASLDTARMTVAVSFCLPVFLVYFLVRHFSDRVTAGLVAGLLSTNYILFSFSRLAILDIPALTIALSAITVTAINPKGKSRTFFALSTLLFAVALLAKSAVLILFPVYLLTLVTGKGWSLKEKLIYGFTALIIVGVLVGGYNYYARSIFPEDYRLFTQLNFSGRISRDLSTIAGDLVGGAKRVLRLEPALVLLSFIFSWRQWRRSPDFRRDPLVRISVLWVVGHLIVMSMTSYHPPRYFIALSIPMTILLVQVGMDLRKKASGSVRTLLPLIMIFLLVGWNGYRVVDYMVKPFYSLHFMCEDVNRIISEDRTAGGSSVLIGHMANTVGLATGLPTINSLYGTQSLSWKMAEYAPQHYISLGEEEAKKIWKRTLG
ncbi:MAG: glycosyltransferase family 39 protein [bacterium]|nr:glycosyltransferase family 39 protein [bacterium]MDT8365298.1 glycosyltransferase family 39 protein [bacterium]